MRDFTLAVYERLLKAFLESGYVLKTFRDFLTNPEEGGRTVILRHDVDRKPRQAVDMAALERDLGADATYYFRIVPESFSKECINAIAEKGHEIGYHYEDLTLAKGDIEEAIGLFETNLSTFRSIQPIKTICMHGSPLTKWDNRVLWSHVDYRTYGILGEPYFDVDFETVLYVTDTGRAWNSDRYSRRDHVGSAQRPKFKTSAALEEAIRRQQLPRTVMMNTHPHRWSDDTLVWGREWAFQRIKNQIKFAISLFSRDSRNHADQNTLEL